MSDTTPQTPEEIRREMRARFDGANTTAQEIRKQTRDRRDSEAGGESEGAGKPDAPVGPSDSSGLGQLGENDSSGG